MSFSYTKLFSSITESTVWCEPAATRICWITMLAMADRKGRVSASVPGLANRARITVEETEIALARFLAPDPYSRTPDHEGRRIEVIDGGWRLLNHAKYRELRDEEARREYKNQWDREHRPRRARNPTNPTISDRDRPRPTQAEAAPAPAPEAAPAPATRSSLRSDRYAGKPSVAPVALPEWLDPEKFKAWIAIRPAKARTAEAQKAAVEKLERFRAQGLDPNAIVTESLSNGWQGIFPPKEDQRARGGLSVGEKNRAAVDEAVRRMQEERRHES